MAKNKTFETESSVEDFLMTIADEKRRNDCAALIKLFAENSGYQPKMWGPSIIGFGSYHYKYESGREGDAPLSGLSPRANAFTLYLGFEFTNRDELLAKFGKHKIKGGCVYVKKIEDINTEVLGEMVRNSVEYCRAKHA